MLDYTIPPKVADQHWAKYEAYKSFCSFQSNSIVAAFTVWDNFGPCLEQMILDDGTISLRRELDQIRF